MQTIPLLLVFFFGLASFLVLPLFRIGNSSITMSDSSSLSPSSASTLDSKSSSSDTPSVSPSSQSSSSSSSPTPSPFPIDGLFNIQLTSTLSSLLQQSPIRKRYPFHSAPHYPPPMDNNPQKYYDNIITPKLRELMDNDKDDMEKRKDITSKPKVLWDKMKSHKDHKYADTPLPPSSLLMGPPPSSLPFSDEINANRAFIRLVIISDTHNSHSLLLDPKNDQTPSLPYGDILIHGGDFSFVGKEKEIDDFHSFLSRVPHPIKIIIAGNHDLSLHRESLPITTKSFYLSSTLPPSSDLLHRLTHNIPGCIYLEDDYVDVLNYRVYGSPWQPEFYEWAWNAKRGSMIRQYWKQIPQSADIIITHGPPLGYGDLCKSGDRAGCYDLLKEMVDRVKPIGHISGHIHEGYGIRREGGEGIVMINGCTLNHHYDQGKMNAPIVWDIPVRGGGEWEEWRRKVEEKEKERGEGKGEEEEEKEGKEKSGVERERELLGMKEKNSYRQNFKSINIPSPSPSSSSSSILSSVKKILHL